ncbi:MAG: ATP-grasp domain-containing protein [Acidobacteriia bacterium]|nr:ATP-grasp domain-containing protein [Terriglobia bacterium]
MGPKKSIDLNTPLVILRSIAHTPLGILRSLGRLGVPTHVVHRDQYSPAFYSRYCQGKFVCDFSNDSPEQSVDRLLAVGRTIGRRSILLPTTDESAMFVADHAAELEPWFLVPLQDAELVHTLCNKQSMHRLARQLGLPVPLTVFPQSREQVEDFAATAKFPVVLKGIYGLKLRKRSGKTMLVIRSAEELLEKYDRFEESEVPNLMLQEYIPGGEDASWMFNGYFNQRSECLLAFTGRKIRQCPVYAGVTSLGVCESNVALRDASIAMLTKLGYRGIVDIDYRFDARDGQYKVLDVNPRIGGTFRLFVTDSDMDVVRALYLDMTGQAVTPGTPCEGRRWIVEDLDLVSCVRYGREGTLSLERWASSLRGVAESAYFAWDDPMPVVPMLINDAREMFRRIHRALRSSLEMRQPVRHRLRLPLAPYARMSYRAASSKAVEPRLK